MNVPETNARDRHLFGPGPKRLLALDGGGVRGAISVGFLEQIEKLVSAGTGRETRLGEWFDLVGGTSTGAIIASAIALGLRTSEIRDFYHHLAPRVFKRSYRRIPLVQAKFDVRALREELEAVLGARTLDSPDLITGLCVVTKRMDSGSPWILANNPRARFWDTPQDGAFLGNRHYKLAQLVRASTAAPSYFNPEAITIAEGEPTGHFIDGGVTPHNNPSLIMFLMSTLKSYGLCWPTGPERLTIASIGTGTNRNTLTPNEWSLARQIRVAVHALMSMMNDSENLVLQLMQWLGECPAPWLINSEVGTLQNDTLPSGPLFRFLRYDVRLESAWLFENLDLQLGQKEVGRLQQMDNPDNIPLAYEIGRLAAERQVKAEHWAGQRS